MATPMSASWRVCASTWISGRAPCRTNPPPAARARVSGLHMWMPAPFMEPEGLVVVLRLRVQTQLDCMPAGVSARCPPLPPAHRPACHQPTACNLLTSRKHTLVNCSPQSGRMRRPTHSCRTRASQTTTTVKRCKSRCCTTTPRWLILFKLPACTTLREGWETDEQYERLHPRCFVPAQTTPAAASIPPPNPANKLQISGTISPGYKRLAWRDNSCFSCKGAPGWCPPLAALQLAQ